MCRYSKNPGFDSLLRKMGKIFDQKNEDYSSGSLDNFFESERIGISPVKGVVLRMIDKMNRICNLLRKDGKREVREESLTDSLLDLANYSLIAILLLEEEKRKEEIE